jgi:protein-S-isoprenylcysteine O-methyltransferase Ste14
VFARPRPWTLFVGGAIAVLGLALRGWAAGHIRKNAALATSGPYAYTRNPLYLGSFVLGLGFTVASGQPLLGILFIALFLGIYYSVMRDEAASLDELFGADYRVYAMSVPLFIPSVRAFRSSQSTDTRFDTSLYLRYREYRAALGLLIAWTILALKATLAI